MGCLKPWVVERLINLKRGLVVSRGDLLLGVMLGMWSNGFDRFKPVLGGGRDWSGDGRVGIWSESGYKRGRRGGVAVCLMSFCYDERYERNFSKKEEEMCV